MVDAVLRGEDPLSAGPGALRFRRVAVRDAATAAMIDFAVGDLITVPPTGWPMAAFLRGEPVLARNPAESRQADLETGLETGYVQARVAASSSSLHRGRVRNEAAPHHETKFYLTSAYPTSEQLRSASLPARLRSANLARIRTWF